MRRTLFIYGLAFALSFVAHCATFEGLGRAAHNAATERDRVLEFAVIKREPPPPAPPPQPPPEPPKPKPKPPPMKTIDLTKAPPPPPEAPPPPNTSEPPREETAAEPARPVFGVTMRSTIGPGSGSGFQVRVGNTLMKQPEAEHTPPAEVKPYAPVPLHRVTKAPRQQGECMAQYPAQAKELRIEGQVKLEVEVRPDGTVGEVKVIKGLGYGLDEAVMEAMKRCHFAPAEMSGQAVATRIPYSYRFVLED